MPATKEFKTIDQRIDCLSSRKLKFKNKDKAFLVLKQYNYFDIINGFESILLKPETNQKQYENVYFEDFYDLYKFDLELNKHTLYKVLDIESRLKTSISYHFAKIHCSTKETTMNYTNKNYYQAPDITDKYLTNKFIHFDLFRKAQHDEKTGKLKQLSYIDELKKERDYINQYGDPPFWVVIKAMPLGALYFTYLFLDNIVKPDVLHDFGFSISNSKIFEQSVYLLKETRNHCAHLELITRFRLKRIEKLNNFNDISAYAGLSKTDLNYMDVLKNLKIYGDIHNIKWTILKFHIKMCVKGRRKISRKIFGKMGNQSILSWMLL